MINGVSLPFICPRQESDSRATAFKKRFFAFSKTALFSLPALDSMNEFALRTWGLPK